MAVEMDIREKATPVLNTQYRARADLLIRYNKETCAGRSVKKYAWCGCLAKTAGVIIGIIAGIMPGIATAVHVCAIPIGAEAYCTGLFILTAPPVAFGIVGLCAFGAVYSTVKIAQHLLVNKKYKQLKSANGGHEVEVEVGIKSREQIAKRSDELRYDLYKIIEELDSREAQIQAAKYSRERSEQADRANTMEEIVV